MKRSPLLIALLFVACNSGPAPAPGPTPEARAAAQAAADARARLGEVRARLAADEVFEALALIDELEPALPADGELAWLRGRAFMIAAEKEPNAAGSFYMDAQASFERAVERGYGPDALLGASRAARMNLEVERALELARAGRDAYEGAVPRPALEESLPRVLSQALFDAFVARKQAGEEAPELLEEARASLATAARLAPGDPWPWAQLATLEQWAGDDAAALAAQEEALLRRPDDEPTHTRAVALARAVGGGEAVLAMYERVEAELGERALTEWFTGVELFELGVAALPDGAAAAPRFEAAERRLARCRALEAGYERSCLGYEVMCRAGLGWARYHQEELEAATSAFLSMNELLDGGVEWELAGRLGSGIQGLLFVADAYARRSQGELDPTGKPEAAALFDVLRELRPQELDFANNAGLFHRDACVGLELAARDRLQRADGWRRVLLGGEDVPIEEARYTLQREEVTPEEAAALRAEAKALREAAVEHARQSRAAYRAAVALAPTDVRVLNDTALVMVYHTRERLDEMLALLTRAIALGEEQTRDPELSEERRFALLEAWGDAHSNLGLYHLTLQNDPAAARRAFERAAEIGPYPRPWIEEAALPACAKAEAGDADALEGLDPRLWLHVGP